MLDDLDIKKLNCLEEFYFLVRVNHGHRGTGTVASALNEARECLICQAMEQTKDKLYELEAIAEGK